MAEWSAFKLDRPTSHCCLTQLRKVQALVKTILRNFQRKGLALIKGETEKNTVKLVRSLRINGSHCSKNTNVYKKTS